MFKSKVEWTLFIISVLLTATAFFALGYLVGHQNIRTPIIIENY